MAWRIVIAGGGFGGFYAAPRAFSYRTLFGRDSSELGQIGRASTLGAGAEANGAAQIGSAAVAEADGPAPAPEDARR